jgi:hypothetical protein
MWVYHQYWTSKHHNGPRFIVFVPLIKTERDIQCECIAYTGYLYITSDLGLWYLPCNFKWMWHSMWVYRPSLTSTMTPVTLVVIGLLRQFSLCLSSLSTWWLFTRLLTRLSFYLLLLETVRWLPWCVGIRGCTLWRTTLSSTWQSLTSLSPYFVIQYRCWWTCLQVRFTFVLHVRIVWMYKLIMIVFASS